MIWIMPLFILMEAYAFSYKLSYRIVGKLQETEDHNPPCPPELSLEFLGERQDDYGCFLPSLDWNSSESSKAQCLFEAIEAEEKLLCLR
jgi:hypothetical protein